MDTILVDLTIGPVKFQYSLMFMIFLFIGWLTVLFHSRDNFDQADLRIGGERASVDHGAAFLFIK